MSRFILHRLSFDATPEPPDKASGQRGDSIVSVCTEKVFDGSARHLYLASNRDRKTSPPLLILESCGGNSPTASILVWNHPDRFDPPPELSVVPNREVVNVLPVLFRSRHALLLFGQSGDPLGERPEIGDHLDLLRFLVASVILEEHGEALCGQGLDLEIDIRHMPLELNSTA